MNALPEMLLQDVHRRHALEILVWLQTLMFVSGKHVVGRSGRV